MLDTLGVELYSTFSDKKASIVERVQRTIRQRLYRHFTKANDHKWVDVIPKLVDSYNDTKHSTTNLKPNMVSREHTKAILTRMYSSPDYIKLMKREKYRRRLLKLGDQVRIIKERTIFTKEAVQKWTSEIFLIRKVERKNFPITYLLSDLNGEEILGSFYFEELQKV